MVYSVRKVIRILEQDGWYLDREESSHRQFRHPRKPNVVTVSGHKMSSDVPIGLLHAIESRAGIKFPRR